MVTSYVGLKKNNIGKYENYIDKIGYIFVILKFGWGNM